MLEWTQGVEEPSGLRVSWASKRVRRRVLNALGDRKSGNFKTQAK